MLQRVFEHAFRILPEDRRYGAERRVRGWFDMRRLRHADFVVASFGKSGRTWVRVMLSRLYQIEHGLPEGTLLEFDNYHRANPSIPRILFTHDNYLRDFTGDGSSKRAYGNGRVVLLVRHPADVTISQYFQWKHRMRPHKVALNQYPPNASDLTPYEFSLCPSGLTKVITWMNEWAQGIDEVRDGMILRYEDMRGDTVRELGRLARFLNIETTPATLTEVAEYASVENMKKREVEGRSGSGRLQAADRSNPDSFKTRRAKVGGYHDYFDADQLRRIEQIIAESLDRRFGYVPATPD